jgi:hypothetical protein
VFAERKTEREREREREREEKINFPTWVFSIKHFACVIK